MNSQAFELPFGMTPVDLATILTGVAMLFVMVAIWAATTVRDPMRGRVKALQARREHLRAGIVQSKKRTSITKSNETTDFMRQILKRLAVLQDEQSKIAAAKLMQAGHRSKDAVVTFMFARLVSPFVLGGLGIAYAKLSGLLDGYSTMTQILGMCAILFFAYKAPDIYLQNKITKRSKEIEKGLPDALDLLVICAEAGLTADAAFNRVARELGGAFPELADELALTAVELGFLQDRRSAYDNLAKRVDLKAMRGVVTTLIQTEKYGTPLASSLRVLSAEFRNERMMRAEEKAARLPAIMTVPLILFILPVLFVVILGPAACSISDNL